MHVESLARALMKEIRGETYCTLDPVSSPALLVVAEISKAQSVIKVISFREIFCKGKGATVLAAR